MSKQKSSTKDLIIESTINIIARDGLIDTTAGNIAKSGEFTKSSIFYYFDNIDELLLESLMRSVDKISPILDSNFKDFRSIDEYLVESIEKIISNKQQIIYLKVILSFAHQSTYLKNNLKDLRNILINDLYNVLFEAIEFFSEKTLAESEKASLSSLIMTTFNGLGVLLLIDGSNEKFLNNWMLQAHLVSNFIK